MAKVKNIEHNTNIELGDTYQNRISKYNLKEGEMYCLSCKQVIKKINLNRHDNSLKHEKNVFKFVERMKKNIS